jgi:hypothetical protein
VAQSLAANLRSFAQQEVTVGAAPDATIDIDSRILTRSLQILAKACARELAAAQTVSVTAAHDAAKNTIDIAAALNGSEPVVLSGDVNLAWEVVAHLVELQGGEARQVANGSSLIVTLTFP